MKKKWKYAVLPRQLKFTRDGKYYFWITIGVGFAAINTGNNLLYLLLGMLLGMIVVSGILSEFCLRELHVERFTPSNIIAETPALISFSVTNKKKYFTSFSIFVEDMVEGVEAERGCFFLSISPGETKQLSYRLTFPRRGKYELGEIKVSTRFPFAIFEKSRRIFIEKEVVVLPPIFQLYPPFLETSPQAIGEQNSNQRGQGLDFFMLREMQPGDEIRWIHWPSSAKSGMLLVRQFEEEHQGEISIALWNGKREDEYFFEKDLDEAISITASLILALVQEGHLVFFTTATRKFPPISSKRDVNPVLRQLALLDFENASTIVEQQENMLLISPEESHFPSLRVKANVLRPSMLQVEEKVNLDQELSFS